MPKFPFDDLSGAELARRLEQRDVPEGVAEVLVDHREKCEGCRNDIAVLLREEPIPD